MSERITVDAIGDGSGENPYRPDYEGGYMNAEYHGDGTVTITTIHQS